MRARSYTSIRRNKLKSFNSDQSGETEAVAVWTKYFFKFYKYHINWFKTSDQSEGGQT